MHVKPKGVKDMKESKRKGKVIFFGKGQERDGVREEVIDEAGKKLPYGVLAWGLNEIISGMNDEEAYYGSWLYVWPDGATREDANDSFGTKEEYQELEDLFKKVYKAYHRSGLYNVSDKTLERAHEWDRKLGLTPIADVGRKGSVQSKFEDGTEEKIGEVLKGVGIGEEEYEIEEEHDAGDAEHPYKTVYFFEDEVAKKALKALRASNAFVTVKGYEEPFPDDVHSAIEILVSAYDYGR